MTHNARSLFLSHGGGPMPLLGDAGHQQMVACLQTIAAQIPKPDAIILISAHWEETITTITSASKPALIYDYYGFPEEAYQLSYPCLGEPKLANKLYDLFEQTGIKAKLDDQRGFDHGMFVPLSIMYPAADIPCVQVSLLNSLDASEHIKIGQALKSVQSENILVIGSGFSFHNMKAFFSPHSAENQTKNENFESWLIQTCNSTELDEAARSERLIHWQQAPFARFCHPREEHLLPLHVCYGFTGQACSEVFELTILNKKASMYLW